MTLRTLLPGPLARALPSLALSSLALLAPPALAQDLRDADVATADVATAEAPPRLTYSGLLTDEAGQPLPDGPRALVFRAYPSAEAARSADAPAWEEAHDAAVVGGRFLVVLGSKAALPAAAGWVTVAVDGAPASTPVRLGQPTDGPVGGAVTGSAGAALAPGNTLQQSYENGRTIDVATGAPLLIRGAPATIGLTVRDITPVFTATQLARFRLSSSSSGRIWEYRVYGSNNEDPGPGYFTIADATGGGADAFQIAPGAGEDVLRLTAGTANVGSPTDPAEFRAYTTPNPSDPEGGFATVELRDHEGIGGALELYEEDGSRYAYLEPDFDGDGGYFDVRAVSGSAFVVNGNAGGGGSIVRIGSGLGATSFDTGQTGTNAVQLPTNAVSSIELANESGVASATGTTLGSLDGTVQNILSRTITAPSAGYVLVVGAGEIVTNNGTISHSVRLGVSNDCDATPTLPASSRMALLIPRFDDVYQGVVSGNAIFSVAARVNPFCLLAEELYGDASYADRQLSVLFVPTAYGTAQAPFDGAPASGPTDGEPGDRVVDAQPVDLVGERAASIRADEDRVAAELDEMRQRIAELEARLDGNGGDR